MMMMMMGTKTIPDCTNIDTHWHGVMTQDLRIQLFVFSGDGWMGSKTSCLSLDLGVDKGTLANQGEESALKRVRVKLSYVLMMQVHGSGMMAHFPSQT